MKKALIDVDNILADTIPYLCRLAYGIWGIEVRPEQWSRFLVNTFHPLMGLDQANRLMKCFHVTVLDVPLFPGAKAGMDWLSERYELVVVTARPQACHNDTHTWLGFHRIPFNRLIMCCDKRELVDGDTILVFDDSAVQMSDIAERVRNLVLVENGVDRPEPVRLFMRDMPPNYGWCIPGVTRVKGWSELIGELSRSEPTS